MIQSDQDLANDWPKRTHDQAHANINVQQSASASLANLDVPNNIDSAPLPTLAEIVTQISDGQPMLTLSGAVDPHGKPNISYRGGHWLVIVGADTVADTVSVFDPQTGKIATLAYNPATYGGYSTGNFWQNTSYLGPA